MFGKYNNLSVSKFEEARNNHIQGGYKYLVQNSWLQGFAAFRTDEGFNDWLGQTNVSLDLKDVNESKDLGSVEIYDVIGEINHHSFWNKSDIPEEAKPFTGLSNGSLVTCYYEHTEKGSNIYKPNPNAKEVYNPLDLDSHLSFIRERG